LSESEQVAEAASRLFAKAFPYTQQRRGHGTGGWSGDQWNALAELALPLALVSENAGGFGLARHDALKLIRLAGYHAVVAPLGETLLANWLLTEHGLPPVDGPATIAPVLDGAPVSLRKGNNGWSLSGTLERVPWGRAAEVVVVMMSEGSTYLVRLHAGTPTIEQSENVAGEARDTLKLHLALPNGSVVTARAGLKPQMLLAAGAAIRTLALAGAMERVLAFTEQYANDRVQFGRPIGKFQAIQHSIAQLAGCVVASAAAADLAAESFRDGIDLNVLQIAAAKARASEAAGLAASIAHQVHGAIGFTNEHSLHVFTSRLWAWREEFGNERFWGALLGRHVLAQSADAFWPFVTAD
jgi:alkylation response protein AidB-like acyl-CoA dehydrogenase